MSSELLVVASPPQSALGWIDFSQVHYSCRSVARANNLNSFSYWVFRFRSYLHYIPLCFSLVNDSTWVAMLRWSSVKSHPWPPCAISENAVWIVEIPYLSTDSTQFSLDHYVRVWYSCFTQPLPQVYVTYLLPTSDWHPALGSPNNKLHPQKCAYFPETYDNICMFSCFLHFSRCFFLVVAVVRFPAEGEAKNPASGNSRPWGQAFPERHGGQPIPRCWLVSA